MMLDSPPKVEAPHPSRTPTLILLVAICVFGIVACIFMAYQIGVLDGHIETVRGDIEVSNAASAAFATDPPQADGSTPTPVATADPCDAALAPFSDNDFRQYALDIVYDLNLRCDDSQWSNCSAAACDIAHERVEAARRQFAHTQPERLHAAIFEWFNYYDGGIARNRQDCVSSTNKRENDSYAEQRAAEEARVRALAKVLASCKRNAHPTLEKEPADAHNP